VIGRGADDRGDLVEREQPRTGEFVDALLVTCFCEYGRGDVGDVVRVDDRLADATGGERDGAVEHGVEEEVLAEVLGEEAAPLDGGLDPGVQLDVFARLRLGLAAT
jgi:hypothetical protein